MTLNYNIMSGAVVQQWSRSRQEPYYLFDGKASRTRPPHMEPRWPLLVWTEYVLGLLYQCPTRWFMSSSLGSAGLDQRICIVMPSYTRIAEMTAWFTRTLRIGDWVVEPLSPGSSSVVRIIMGSSSECIIDLGGGPHPSVRLLEDVPLDLVAGWGNFDFGDASRLSPPQFEQSQRMLAKLGASMSSILEYRQLQLLRVLVLEPAAASGAAPQQPSVSRALLKNGRTVRTLEPLEFVGFALPKVLAEMPTYECL